MHLRFRQVREEKGLSQQEFAKKLGLQRNSISLIETGNRNPSDRTINDLCKIFRISEHWLRTGEGEMTDCKSVDAIDSLAEEFGLDETDKDIIYSYITVPQYFRKSMRVYIKGLLEVSSKELRLEEEETKVAKMEATAKGKAAFMARAGDQFDLEKNQESQASFAKESGAG